MQGKTKKLKRFAEQDLLKNLQKKQSSLLLGPRQVGKSTLVESVLNEEKFRRKPGETMKILLQDPSVRIELEKDPGALIRQVEAKKGLVRLFVDEAQKVPELFDALQVLIDRKKICGIITGSSAHKLRKRGANLLPGRVKKMALTPLLWGELGWLKGETVRALNSKNINAKGTYSFEESLVFGHLPGLLSLTNKDRAEILQSYVELYLEEEIRAETQVRKLGAFARFLELVANESGSSPNLTKLSNEVGVKIPDIKEFFQILEDTLVVERIDPYLKNARKRILSSPRYYLFDLGVRNALARLPLEPGLLNAQKGVLFEHAVVLELARRIKTSNKTHRLYYWRTGAGAEVDLIVDTGKKLIPIEIKASNRVRLSELKGLRNFLEDYSEKATQGYVITMGGKKEKLSKNITSVPWNEF